MLCCCSLNIDEKYDFDKLETPKQKKVKILVLGPSDAGKTTIIKQLKLLNNMYDEEDSKNMTNYIRDSVLSNMKTLCDQSLMLKEHYNLETAVHRSVEYLRDEILSLHSSSNLLFNNIDIAYKIKELWNDDGIQNTLKYRHRFQIDDNINYFFNKIEQISAQNYSPDFDDYVRIRRRSIGYSPTKFVKYVDRQGEYHFEIPDVGGTRSERRKWWSPKLLLDDNVKAIIFVVPLSDYNITLYEDNETNRLKDSIELFKNIMIKGKFFKDKRIMLFFNKYDLFVEKMNSKEIPITVCFNDFDESESDPNNVDDVMKFVAGKFLSVFHDNDINLSKPLRILRTNAIDTENIRDTFDKILPDIVAKHFATFEIDKD